MHVLQEETQYTAASITSCVRDTKKGLPSAPELRVWLLVLAAEPTTVKL